MSPEKIAAVRATAKSKDDEGHVVEIEPENWDAFRLFRRMLTQWHTQSVVAGTKLVTVKTGLNYAALAVIRDELGIAPSQHTIDAIGLMEAEALVIHQRRETAQLRRR